MSNRTGQIWIGFNVPMINPMSIEFDVESDAPFLLHGRPSYCENYYPSVVTCYIEIPVLKDVHNVKIKYGTVDWSEPVNIGAIPCGYFVGEQVFPSLKEWAGQFGVACNEIIQTGPSAPFNLRIQVK